jgi:hypothetical protein
MEKKRAKGSLDKFNRMKKKKSLIFNLRKKKQIHIRREKEIKSFILKILN